MNANELRRLFAEQQRRDDYVTESLRRVLHNQAALFRRIDQLENTMSKELVDAVNRINTSSARLIQDAVTKLQQPDPDVVGAIASLGKVSDAMDAESDVLEANGVVVTPPTDTTGS